MYDDNGNVRSAAREAAGTVAEKARGVETAVISSAPSNWIRTAWGVASDVMGAVWNRGSDFLQRHPQINTFVRLWLLFGAIPLLIWAAVNAGSIIVTLGIAALILTGLNGAFLLLASAVLGFALFFTTGLAGTTYFLVFTYGIIANATRRTYRYLSGTLDEVMAPQK